MRTPLLVFLIILTHLLYGQYEESFYTVIAPSGLSLRAGPGVEHERLTAIPFNEQVTALSNEVVYDQQDTINHIGGYWLPVRYGQHRGYLFSAYLKEGHLFKPAQGEQNQDFRIVIPGLRSSALNYDPTLHWYALVARAGEETGAFLLRKVEPKIQLEPFTIEEQFNWGAEGLIGMEVEEGMEDYVALLVGTRQPLPALAQLSQKTYYNPLTNYLEWGQPLFPFQFLELCQSEGGDRYILSGHVESLAVQETDQHQLAYYLGVSKNYYPVEDDLQPHQRLSWELATDDAGVPRSFNHHPRIFWQGDLNGDQLPDLIFYQPNTSECCGGSESYFLLLSEEKETGWEWHRIADDTLESIGGC